MSQEEHILHELKEMHGWIAHADKQISRVKWSLFGILSIQIITMLLILVKK